MSSAEDQVTEVDPKVVEEATNLGWTPKEKFRGDPAKWVDAQTYVERGHQIMPILRKTNARLETELATVRGELPALRETVKELRESLKTMTEFQAAEVKRQVDVQIAVLKKDKKAAIASGDREQEAEIVEQLDELNEKKQELATAPTPKPAAAASPPPADTPPWAVAFAEDNKSWWMVDKRRTAHFMVEAEELRASSGLTGRALLDKAKEATEEFFDAKAPQKVEGGSGGPAGGGGGGSRGNGKSYADLPSEAKQVIQDQKSKMVGPNKPFKDEASWRAHYVKTYFGDE
jgi:hypothetical protein